MNDNLDEMIESTVNDSRILNDQARQVLWEERVVKRIINRLGLTHLTKQIKDSVKEHSGIDALTFNGFNDCLYENYCQYFPVKIVTMKIPYIHQTTINDLFNKFFKLSFVKEFIRIIDENDDVPCGLVFEWPHIKAAMMVIHNLNEMSVYDFRLSKNFKNHTIHLQSFDSFLEYVNDHVLI